jgi:signal transduction histidine kinase
MLVMRRVSFAIHLLLLAATALADDAPQKPPRLAVHELLINDRPVELTHPQPFSLQTNHPIQIVFGSHEKSKDPAVGFRFKLEGRDQGWYEAHEPMRLEIRFFDKEDRAISGLPFLLDGQSPGWMPNESERKFSHRRKTFAVPQEAVRMTVSFLSAGADATTGHAMIDNLRLSYVHPPAMTDALVWSDDFEQGQHLDDLFGAPHGWQREGTLINIARTATQPVADNEQNHVLLLEDADPHRFGAWHFAPGLTFQERAEIKRGCTMHLEWDELFYTNTSALQTTRFVGLAPGPYRLVVEATDDLGTPTGDTLAVAWKVVVPFWKTTWFAISMGLISIAMVAGGARWEAHRRFLKQLKEAEQQRQIEAERSRIARDLHDDIGSNLTQIALLSELAQADLHAPQEASQHLNRIFNTAKGLARQLDEIVWAVNPKNDSLEHLADYFCKFAQEFLQLANIACRFDIPGFLPDAPLDSRQRHSLFLALKEALHNVVKHAAATEVRIRMAVEENRMVISIQDNGIGMDARQETHQGRGLKNMRERLTHIGGEFQCSSQPQQGTTLQFSLVLSVKPH